MGAGQVRRMRSRDVQRFTRQVTEQQRSYSGGQPDGQIMSVTAQAPNGRYVCKKDHWDTGGILVKSTPPGSRVIFPSVRKVYFEDGDRLRPFMLGTLSEREAWPVTLGGAVLTADWRCAHANFQRDNSYTAATFDFAAADTVTSLADLAGVASGKMPRFYQGHSAFVSPDYRIVEPEDEDYDEEIGEGDPYQLGPFLFQRIPEYPDFWWAHNLGAPGGLGYEIADWETWAANSLAILDDGEIVLGWQEGEDATHYLSIFANDGTGGWRKNISLPGSTSLPISLRGGADTVQVGDHLCTPVVNESTGAEYLHIWQVSTDTEEAEVVELTGADSAGLVVAVWGNPEDTLPQSWVAGNLCIVQDGSGGLYAVNPTVTTAPAWIYAGTKRVRPLAVDGTRLVCAYEAATYETVTDVFASTDYVDAGPTEEDRDLLAEGKSTTGGLLFIFAASGAEISAAEFSGEESYGSSLGPVLEERTTHEGPSWTSEAHPDPMLDSWPSYWPAILVFMRAALYIGADPGNAPEESETYPYADSPLGDLAYEAISAFVSLPPDDDSDYYHAVVAKMLAYREALVRQVFEVFGARPSPAHFIKWEGWQFTWSSISTDGNAYDGLHSYVNGPIEGDPPSGTGNPDPNVIGVPENYEGTDEAGSIPDTEEPVGDWVTGPAVKTFNWQAVKVWSNVQEEYELTRTASPQHAFGPVCIAHGLIVHGPKGILDSGNDAHWVARRPSSPSEPEWTFTVEDTGSGVLTGNVWADSARFWIEYSTNGGTDFQLVGLLPATGEPDSGDPEILIESAGVVFDGANVHDEFTEWAIGPG